MEWRSCSWHPATSCHIDGIPLTNRVSGRGGELVDAGTGHLTATGCLAAFQLIGVARRITIGLRCDELRLNLKCHDWSWSVVSGQKVKKQISDHKARQKSWHICDHCGKAVKRTKCTQQSMRTFFHERITNRWETHQTQRRFSHVMCYSAICRRDHGQSRTRGTVPNLPGRF